MAKSSCVGCGNKFDSELLIKRSGKKYCERCIEEKDRDNEEWGRLFEYIKKIYNVDKPSIKMLTQIKKFKEEYNFSNSGIYYTLKYMNEILDKNLLDDTLGILPYYYDEAKRHYKKVFDIQDIVEEFNCESNEVYIKVKKNVRNVKNNKKTLSFDLVWGGDGEYEDGK